MLPLLLICIFVAIVALTLLLARMSALATRLGDLESKLRQALGLIGELDTRIRTLERVRTPSPEKPRRVLRRRPPAAEARAGGAKKAAAFPAPITPALIAAPAPTVRPVPARSRTKEEWEALIGGKLLNRIGALALILGVGFFLQYAFVNDWITEPVRVLIGIGVGAALLAGAARSAAGGFQIFAQGLVGAGIAILYLSVYASFNYYHLVAQPWAFVFMSLVTVVAFTQAFRYNSIVVALLGLIGGFLTPFLLSTGEVNPVGLFTYLALLDLGLLVVAWRRDSWMPIEPLSMAGTYLIYVLWLAGDYTPAHFVPGLLFLLLFWLMFHAVHCLRLVRSVRMYPVVRLTMASIHGAVFSVLLFTLVNIDHPDWRVVALLGAAVVYGATALAARRTSAGVGMFLHPVLTAMILIVWATWIQFKGMALVQYWTVEALALTWAGTQWRFRSVWGSGVVLYALAFLVLLGTAGAIVCSAAEPFTLLFNNRAFTFLLLAACLALSAALFGRIGQRGAGSVRVLFHVAWCWVLFLLITLETNDAFAQMIRTSGVTQEQHLNFLRLMVLAVVWGAYAPLLVLAGTRRGIRPLVASGLMMLFGAGCLAAVRGVTYVPIGDFVPLLNERVLLLLLLIGEYTLARRILPERREGTGLLGRIPAALQAGIVLFVLVIITGEIWDFYARGIDRLAFVAGSVNIAEEMSRLRNLRQLLLSVAWLVFSILLMGLGIWRRVRGVRVEAIMLFGVSILKIFIYDLSFLDTLYRIFSFVGLGVILLAVSYLYQRSKDVILGSNDTGGGTV